MNVQQSQPTIDALSCLFASNLVPNTRASSVSNNTFNHYPVAAFPKDLSLRVGLAPDCFVGVRITVIDDAHADLNAMEAPLLIAEGPFGRAYVRIEQMTIGQYSMVFGPFDEMDISEDEMYGSEMMDLD